MKVKIQKCTECQQIYKFKELVEIMHWCPRCFHKAINENIRFIAKRLIEVKDNEY